MRSMVSAVSTRQSPARGRDRGDGVLVGYFSQLRRGGNVLVEGELRRWRLGDDGKPAQKSKNKKDAAKRADVLVEHLRVAEHALKVLDPADVPGACAGSAPGGAEDSDAAKGPIGWSKSMAYQNMRFIDVTLDVFQAPMSSLKSVEKWNNCSMSVTSEVSHAAMGPYAASAAARSDSHSSTAALIVSSFIARPPPTSPSTAAQSRMVEAPAGLRRADGVRADVPRPGAAFRDRCARRGCCKALYFGAPGQI